jgi:hypothetical protein
MKGNEVFPSKWLKAADLGTSEPVVTIKKVEMETLGDETKPVLYFEGKDRGLVMNKTNWSTVVDITGQEDSDDWKGHKIKLYVAKVEFQGKRVPSIRIDSPPNGLASNRVRQAPAEHIEPIDEDSIPF